MTEFQSIHPGLGFYVDGQFYKFSNGKFKTNDEKVIAKLKNLSGVKLVHEEKPQKETPKKEPKAEAKTKKK
jgi:hypothetical protein